MMAILIDALVGAGNERKGGGKLRVEFSASMMMRFVESFRGEERSGLFLFLSASLLFFFLFFVLTLFISLPTLDLFFFFFFFFFSFSFFHPSQPPYPTHPLRTQPNPHPKTPPYHHAPAPKRKQP
jgi:hypothetical protein